jgi:vacuolar iron transporter family protein
MDAGRIWLPNADLWTSSAEGGRFVEHLRCGGWWLLNGITSNVVGSKEKHFARRSPWIRAGVLGANDGLISTSSLIVGVAAANASRSAILIAGIAGLTAGAFSMAAGEYVSVSSQRDSERADIAIERRELLTNPSLELDELTDLYQSRGLDRDLARSVATKLSESDALAAHARDELGIDQQRLANPWQAAIISALTFTTGAILPILVVMVTTTRVRSPVLIIATLMGLTGLGSVGARLGGAPVGRAAVRVVLGGSLALAASLLIGNLSGNIA